MSSTTGVVLLTGFLGSGKTTLLNRLIAAVPDGVNALILMNEFGEIGVDGLLVETEELEMIEINRGSIFCACVKSDFIKALVDIHTRLRPELLIIEATGVANPNDLRRNLELSLFDGRFRFAEQICLIDAYSFSAVYETFTSVEEQIKTSTRFVLNKTDLATAEELTGAEEIIRNHAPEAEIIRTTFARVPEEWLTGSAAPGGRAPEPDNGLDPAVLEALINEVMADPEASLKPSDRLASAVYAWQGGGREELLALAGELPAELVRIKGFVSLEGRPHLFSRAVRQTEILPREADPVLEPVINRLVFIAHPDALDRLEGRFLEDPRLNIQSSLDQISSIILDGI